METSHVIHGKDHSCCIVCFSASIEAHASFPLGLSLPSKFQCKNHPVQGKECTPVKTNTFREHCLCGAQPSSLAVFLSSVLLSQWHSLSAFGTFTALRTWPITAEKHLFLCVCNGVSHKQVIQPPAFSDNTGFTCKRHEDSHMRSS